MANTAGIVRGVPDASSVTDAKLDIGFHRSPNIPGLGLNLDYSQVVMGNFRFRFWFQFRYEFRFRLSSSFRFRPKMLPKTERQILRISVSVSASARTNQNFGTFGFGSNLGFGRSLLSTVKTPMLTNKVSFLFHYKNIYWENRNSHLTSNLNQNHNTKIYNLDMYSFF